MYENKVKLGYGEQNRKEKKRMAWERLLGFPKVKFTQKPSELACIFKSKCSLFVEREREVPRGGKKVILKTCIISY